MRIKNNSVTILAKELLRRIFVIVLLAGSALYLIRSSSADLSVFTVCYSDISDLLSVISYFISVLVFVNLSVFTFLAYLFVKQARIKGLEETISAIPAGANKTLRDQFFVLLLLGFGVTSFSLFILAVSFYRPFYMIIHEYPLFVSNLVFGCIIYSGLSILLGIVVGATGAVINNDFFFLFCFLAFVFLSNPITEKLYMSIGLLGIEIGGVKTGAALQKAFGFFNKLSPVINTFFDPTIGIQLVPTHLGIYCFWIILFLGIFVIFSKAHKKIIGILCIFASIAVLFIISPYCCEPIKRMSTSAEDLYQKDIYWYRENVSENKTEKEEEQNNLFSIVEEELSFSSFEKLYCQCELTLSRTDLYSYDFTLYHGFTITRIYDAKGKGLLFDRDGDYVTIYSSDSENMRHISISYSGYHTDLYSVWQGMYLPGYFAFYPIEGRVSLWNDEEGILQLHKYPKRHFVVNVKSIMPVFCNLPQVEKGVFEGTASSVTIICGMYRETVENGIRYIAPWCISPENISELLKNRTEIKTVIYSPSLKTPVPGKETGYSLVLDDTLLIGTTFSGNADRSKLEEAIGGQDYNDND